MGLSLSHSLDDLESDDVGPLLGDVGKGVSLSGSLNPLSVPHNEVGESDLLEIGEDDRLELE